MSQPIDNDAVEDSWPWLRVTASYFHPINSDLVRQLESAFGPSLVRGSWAYLELADVQIAEEDYTVRQRALDEFLRVALAASDEVTRIVGRRASREEGFLRIGLTLDSSPAEGGISFPDWFLARFFAHPSEFNIS